MVGVRARERGVNGGSTCPGEGGEWWKYMPGYFQATRQTEELLSGQHRHILGYIIMIIAFNVYTMQGCKKVKIIR